MGKIEKYLDKLKLFIFVNGEELYYKKHTIEAMEQYHQDQLKEIIPTDEEIEKEFPINSRNYLTNASAQIGAMWVQQRGSTKTKNK